MKKTAYELRISDWSSDVCSSDLLETLVLTGCIPDGSKIWWDVRPHWKFPTLEFRVCDVCTRVDEAVAIAAILQAIVAQLWRLGRDNRSENRRGGQEWVGRCRCRVRSENETHKYPATKVQY